MTCRANISGTERPFVFGLPCAAAGQRYPLTTWGVPMSVVIDLITSG
jgi:hypothetical protein